MNWCDRPACRTCSDWLLVVLLNRPLSILDTSLLFSLNPCFTPPSSSDCFRTIAFQHQALSFGSSEPLTAHKIYSSVKIYPGTVASLQHPSYVFHFFVNCLKSIFYHFFRCLWCASTVMNSIDFWSWTTLLECHHLRLSYMIFATAPLVGLHQAKLNSSIIYQLFKVFQLPFAGLVYNRLLGNCSSQGLWLFPTWCAHIRIKLNIRTYS